MKSVIHIKSSIKFIKFCGAWLSQSLILLVSKIFDYQETNQPEDVPTDPMVQWLSLPTANPEVVGSNPG
jgi:hypothetical protein